MSEHHDIAFTLNGKPVSATVEARLHLADFLRHTLRLTGTHVGCEHGVLRRVQRHDRRTLGAELPDAGGPG